MSYVEFTDGAAGLVGADGWVDLFDAVELKGVTPAALESSTPVRAYIDVDATSVIDTELLPQRSAFVGPAGS